MIIVGAYVGFSKLLVAVFPVFLLAWLRFGIATVAMSTWLKTAPNTPPLDTRTRYLVFLESFLGNFLFSICMLFGMLHATAISAGVIMAGIPAAVALLSRLFLNERLSARMMKAMYLIETMMVMDQKIIDRIPSTLACVSAKPCAAWKHSFSA